MNSSGKSKAREQVLTSNLFIIVRLSDNVSARLANIWETNLFCLKLQTDNSFMSGLDVESLCQYQSAVASRFFIMIRTSSRVNLSANCLSLVII